MELGQSRPCGLCTSAVDRSDFQSGRAKLIQNVLYCVQCTQEVERARVETTAFKCSLQQGGIYSCAHCQSPVPLQDIQAGGVVYVDHQLSCRTCAKDLLKILARGRSQRGKTGRLGQSSPTHAAAPLQSARLPRSPDGTPSAGIPRAPEGQTGTGFSRPPGPAGTGFARPPEAQTQGGQTGRFRPEPAAEPPPAGKTGRFRPTDPAPPPPSGQTGRLRPTDPAPPRPTGRTGRLPPPDAPADGPAPASVSRRSAPANPTLPARIPCAGCDEPVDPADPRTLVRNGDTFCPACATGLHDILHRSSESLAALGSFSCAGCGVKVTFDDLVNDRAVRSRGEIYCATCKNDFGRASIEREGRAHTRASAVTVLPTVPCSRCARPIPPVEVRSGKAHVIGEKMICAPCKQELDAAADLRRRKAQIACAHCERQIRPHELEQKRVVHHAGNIYCAKCGNDPTVMLGKSGHADAEGRCGSCGDALDDGVCVPCAAKLATLHRESSEASEEIQRRVLIARCDLCRAEVPAAEVETGEAVKNGKTLCKPCIAKQGKPTCRKCGGELAAPKIPCAACAGKERDAKVEAEEWMGLSSEGAVELRCGRCSKAVTVADIGAGRARSVAGTLECAGCAARRPAGGAGRECPTCDGRIQGKGVERSGRRFCEPCGAVFQQLLTEAGIAPGDAGACKLCKKPVGGGLRLPDGAYCAGCRPRAELLVQLTVREQRSKPRKKPGAPIPRGMVMVATAGIIFVSLAVLVATTSAARRDTPVVAPVARKVDSAAEAALGRALRLMAVAPRSYEEARDLLANVQREVPAIKADTNLASSADDVLNRARSARDAFAPAFAATALDEARRANMVKDLDGAVAALERFPAELAHTPAAKAVTDTLARYKALAECTRRGREMLRGRPTSAQLAGLLGSPEAIACEFGKSDLGKTIDAEMRRLRNAEAAGGNQLDARAVNEDDDIKVAMVTAEKVEARGDLAGAETAFRKLLARWPNHVPAQIAAARVTFLRGQAVRARAEAERAGRLAPDSPDAAALLAWLAWLDRDGHAASAERLIATAGANKTPLGKRLAALLALGAPGYEGARVRIYARNVPAKTIEALAAPLEHMAELSAEATSVPRREDRVSLVLLDGADRERLIADLGPIAAMYVVAPQGRDPVALSRALTAAIAARSTAAPNWLVAALPESITGPKPAPATDRMPLAELDTMAAATVLGNARARQTAIHYAALARTVTGARQLARYTVDRSRNAPKARADLESALRAMGGS